MRKVDPERQRARRQQIVGAAAALFAERGFDRTTTAEICAAAGMSSGNLFHYFPNKRAILHALYEGEPEERAERERRLAAARDAADPWEGLRDTVDLLAADALAPLVPALVMEAMVQAYRDQELAELLERDNLQEHGTLVHLLKRTASASLTDPSLEPESTATWIQALIGTLYTSAATDPSFDPAVELPTLHLIITRYLRPTSG
ncbi:TetR/AcrR family transcriptional regulator [Actinocorallia sp. A-T 12471]|uniref:TetR/AcrR family transcriptional regulator n=1 Tax=Actinocorallia sp. A-T 12471 TaxID=3089813 RepID=UPI0029D350E8|nr:TetR/AcrR family transcriptional regulator [Actinocorallia sp. A-T 12471]MDX6739350.1 TetR/AcrR family transcriptional regulator [Actinocorallia sp. A-T 12471]